jgi:chaperonin cofactor prefoldin
MKDKKNKIYLPNRNLEMTRDAEIQRLLKVIDEKNALIEKFKSYDAQRNDYVRRLQKNYELMEERFVEFNNALEECEGLEDDVMEYYKNVVKRLYTSIIEIDELLSFMQVMNARLAKQKELIGSVQCTAALVGNAERRAALLDDVKKLFDINNQIVSILRKKYISLTK